MFDDDIITWLWRLFLGVLVLLAVGSFFLGRGCAPAHAASSIPREAYVHKTLLIRSAHAHWGLDAPTATFAAQVHVESRWRSNAISPVGARGMAQFMPSTSKWIAGLYPHLTENAPSNPGWAMRALVTLNRWNWERLSAVDPCNRMAKTLAAYNGGLGWVQRDEKAATRQGLNPAIYWENVEITNGGRRASAKKENTTYVRWILRDFESVYHEAGFGPGICLRIGHE